jgi:alkanesulfonate monooxygenase SsuD/methylene tetrahydromethanopterin reductase-like flavin-dependent oxidoreductase (luciferase family)
VQIGVYIPQVGITFDALLARALRVEAMGFNSLWVFDHLYSPGLPAAPAFEGWTLATALLARTTTLRVGHLVLDNNLRHPALVARMASTLDVISGGRLELGIGSGSYELEHHQGGFAWGTVRERSERLEEALEIITRMCTGEPTTFAGTHYQVDDLPNLPPPTQQPHPPIHIGGVGPRYTIPLVAKYADVWNVPTYGLADWKSRIPALEAACEQAGRDPAEIRRSLEAVLVVAPDEAALAGELERAERRYQGAGWGLHEGGFIGTSDQIVERLRTAEQDGVDLVIVFPSDRGERDMLDLLATEVLPNL